MIRKRAHKELLKRIDMLKAIRYLVDDDDWDGENVPCLFAEGRHSSGTDSKPSMSINAETGATVCFTGNCDYRASSIVGLAENVWETDYEGSITRLWSLFIEPVVDEDDVEAAHERLMENRPALQLLKAKRGLTKATARKLKLGWQRKRLWIPIRNRHGMCVDVRKYDLSGEADVKIFSYAKGYGGARVFPHDFLRQENPYFFFEGELDTALAIQLGINAVTVTSGASTIPKSAAAAFKDCDVIVVPDNDKAGLKGAKKRLRAFRRAGATVSMIDPPWGEGEDFTDWILGGGDADTLAEHVGDTVAPSEMPQETVDLELSDRELEMVERAESVLRHLKARGAFFQNDEGQIFYSTKGKVLDISGSGFASYLSTISPLVNPANTAGRFIMAHVKNAAMQVAQQTNMGAWALFREPATIFVHAGESNLLKVASSGVTTQSNAMGEDHVLIEAPIRDSAITWDKSVSISRGIRRMFGLVANNIACSEADRYLVVCWLMGVMFREYIRAKPLLRFVAKSSSGKSTATKLLSQLIYSEELLNPAASTVAAAYYMSRSYPILFFDNIEIRNMVPAFEDFLMSASTGGTKHKRKIQDDKGIVRERINCLICSNGIEPLSRSELINRTLEIDLDLKRHGRKKQFHEFEILKRISQERNVILTALLDLIRLKVFPRIGDEVGRIAREIPSHSMERFDDYFGLMAVFLDAIWKYRPSNQWDSPNELFKSWISAQDKSSQERRESTDTVLEFLEGYVERRSRLMEATVAVDDSDPCRVEIKCTMRELLNDFRILARHLGIKIPWNNERQLGVRMADAEDMMSRRGWTQRKFKSNGRQKIALVRTMDKPKRKGKRA